MVAHSSPIRTYMVRLREGIPPAGRRTAAHGRGAESRHVADSRRLERRTAGVGTRAVAWHAEAGVVRRHGRIRTGARHRLRQRRRAHAAAVDAAAAGSGRAPGARLGLAACRTDAARGNLAHLWCGARARRGAHRVPARHARAARRNTAWPSGPGGVGHHARHDGARDGRSRQPARGRGALSGAADGVGPRPDECAAAGCTGGDRRSLHAARAQRADRVRACRLARAARRLRADDPQRRADDGRRSRVRAARALGIPHHAARAPLSRRRRVSPFSRAVCRRALDDGRRAGRVQHVAAFRAAAGACHRAGRRTRDRTGRIDRRQLGVLRGVRHSAPAGPRLHARGSVDGCGGCRDQRVAGPAAVARRQRARPARPQRRAHAGRIDAGAVAHHHRHRGRRAAGVPATPIRGTSTPREHPMAASARSTSGAIGRRRRSSTICDASRRASIATR